MEELKSDGTLAEFEYRLQEAQAQRMRAEDLFYGYAPDSEDDDDLRVAL
ncbi:MAG TPA: hypothetical protein VER04_16245 [Polyangiaceae bacterium]|nr:hypothetical protein [Polyangiaceae bacterium]